MSHDNPPDTETLGAALATAFGLQGRLLALLLAGPRPLNCAEVARSFSCQRAHLSRAKNRLAELGVIARDGSGNWSVRAGSSPGQPSGAYPEGYGEGQGQPSKAYPQGYAPDTEGSQSVILRMSKAYPQGYDPYPTGYAPYPTGYVPYPTGYASGGPESLPPPETPPISDFDIKNARAHAHTRGEVSEPPPSRRDVMAAELGGALPGDVVPDERLMKALVGPGGHLERWFPMQDILPRQAMTHRYQIETAWMYRAFKRVRVGGKSSVGWGYVFAVIRPWLNAGAPDSGNEDLYDDDLRLLPPSEAAKASAQFKPARAAGDDRPLPARATYTPEQLATMKAERERNRLSSLASRERQRADRERNGTA